MDGVPSDGAVVVNGDASEPRAGEPCLKTDQSAEEMASSAGVEGRRIEGGRVGVPTGGPAEAERGFGENWEDVVAALGRGRNIPSSLPGGISKFGRGVRAADPRDSLPRDEYWSDRASAKAAPKVSSIFEFECRS